MAYYDTCIHCGKEKPLNSSDGCKSCRDERVRQNPYLMPQTKVPAELDINLLDLAKVYTLQEIGDMYGGVSRERIRQKLKKLGFTKRQVSPTRSVHCSTEGCPSTFRTGFKIRIPKCNSCKLWEANNLHRPPEERSRRRWEEKAPMPMCINHPDTPAKTRFKKLCNACYATRWYYSDRGRFKVKEYQDTHKEYISAYQKQYNYKKYSAMTQEEKDSHNARSRAYFRNKWDNDPEFRERTRAKNKERYLKRYAKLHSKV